MAAGTEAGDQKTHGEGAPEASFPGAPFGDVDAEEVGDREFQGQPGGCPVADFGGALTPQDEIGGDQE